MNANVDTQVSNWVRVCGADEVFEGMGVRYELEGHEPLAVFNVEGKFHVTADTCSHGNASLADGWLEGDQIECPFHQGRFCVRTGQALTMPAESAIRVYPSKLEDGQVFVSLE